MKIAAIQMVSIGDVEVNLNRAAELLAQASEGGAEFVLLPENFLSYGVKPQDIAPRQTQLIDTLAQLARRFQLWVAAGTLPYLVPPTDNSISPRLATKPFATSLVFDKDGKLRTQYHKTHLFDARVDDAKGSYSESTDYAPGSDLGVCDTPWGKFGIAVCYDLRFPEYFRRLVDAGVILFLVPAAFTYVTGQAHWEVLLRARAIENQCFVVAANQGGTHSSSRQTWGQSMVVNPWGGVIDTIEKGEGIICVDLDLAEVNRVRKEMPVLEHRRF